MHDVCTNSGQNIFAGFKVTVIIANIFWCIFEYNIECNPISLRHSGRARLAERDWRSETGGARLASGAGRARLAERNLRSGTVGAIYESFMYLPNELFI